MTQVHPIQAFDDINIAKLSSRFSNIRSYVTKKKFITQVILSFAIIVIIIAIIVIVNKTVGFMWLVIVLSVVGTFMIGALIYVSIRTERGRVHMYEPETERRLESEMEPVPVSEMGDIDKYTREDIARQERKQISFDEFLKEDMDMNVQGNEVEQFYKLLDNKLIKKGMYHRKEYIDFLIRSYERDREQHLARMKEFDHQYKNILAKIEKTEGSISFVVYDRYKSGVMATDKTTGVIKNYYVPGRYMKYLKSGSPPQWEIEVSRYDDGYIPVQDPPKWVGEHDPLNRGTADMSLPMGKLKTLYNINRDDPHIDDTSQHFRNLREYEKEKMRLLEDRRFVHEDVQKLEDILKVLKTTPIELLHEHKHKFKML